MFAALDLGGAHPDADDAGLIFSVAARARESWVREGDGEQSERRLNPARTGRRRLQRRRRVCGKRQAGK
jgi:hypothetical protein